MASATVSILHDTRRAKKGSTYPVKLRVIHDRIAKYYPTTFNLTVEEYSKLFEEKPIKRIKEIRDDLFELRARAVRIINKLPRFSLPQFERKLFQRSSEDGELFQAFENYIGVLKLAGRVSTAVSYQCSVNSLKSFKSDLGFEDITVPLLQEYEKWMLRSGSSPTTIGIYLRNLRSVYNEAIAEDSISRELYPFGRRKYQIPTGKNTKKALSLSDIRKIFEYEPAHCGEARAKGFWLFSYLCNGINMKDIARLRRKDIDRDFMTLIRAKTQGTNRSSPKPIKIHLIEEAKRIIHVWGAADKDQDAYLFPILEPDITPEREMQLVQQLVKTVNKWMKKIGEKLGIEKEITTYTARHSFSTVLKRSGASIDVISEALGHSNVRTTESYLDSFEDETIKKYSASLVDFPSDNS
jgi:integrase